MEQSNREYWQQQECRGRSMLALQSFSGSEASNMTRIKRSRSDEKQSWDVEEAVRKRKRRKFLEFLEIKTSKKLQNPKVVKHEGGEPGGKERLHTPKEEKPVMEGQPCQMVSFMLHDDHSVSEGFRRQNGFHKQEDERGTRSGIRNNFCRRLIRSSAKADCIWKGNSLDNPMVLSDDGSKLNEKDLSVKSSAETIKPSSRTWSSLRIHSMRSSRKGSSTGRISAGQSRLRLCNICNKSFPNLSTVSESNLFLCSVCRRKSKAVDIASSLDIDFQAHTAKSPRSGRKQQENMRARDIAGKTPDTAVKIDSSDDEEEAVNGSRSAMNSRERRQSDLQRPVKRIAYPSRAELEAIEILDSDVENLEPSEYLNDTIIDFYIKYIQREFLGQERDGRFHFFNSFFYKKLSGVAGKKTKKKVPDFSKLRKWTKGINIFEKDYLIIPVHDKLHWSLAIICFPYQEPDNSSRSERCILHLDSMVCGHQSLTIFRLLRRYLVAEWKDTFGEAKMKGDDIVHTLTCNVIPGKKVPVPLQENESDCGLFILHFIRKFVENAPNTMKISDVEDRLEDLGVFGREWFSPVEASNLRTSIQKILRSLFAKNGVVLDKSRGISFGINDNVKPRNLETEFRIYL